MDKKDLKKPDLEALGAAIYDWNHGRLVQLSTVCVVFQQRHGHTVDPTTRHNGVQAADDEVKLTVKPDKRKSSILH